MSMTPTKKETTTRRAPRPAAKKAAPARAAVPKKAAEKTVKPAEKRAPAEMRGDYVYAVGRRKRAIAAVRLYPKGKGDFTVNGKTLAEHLPVDILQQAVLLPLVTVGMDKTADVSVKAEGGGIHGQADAIMLGVARAILKIDPGYRASLKPLGLLTRDSRKKERKKPGLKKARRAPQWAKR